VRGKIATFFPFGTNRINQMPKRDEFVHNGQTKQPKIEIKVGEEAKGHKVSLVNVVSINF